MIFISHNYKDKPIVEQIALRLKNIYGQDQVFYDSWSIQPGDGIIDKMNQGLADCKLFFFCVSKSSLQSKMVSLEWQNAIVKMTQGQTKLIPIRLDDSLMPPILLQTLYVDLFGQGIEIALRQIVDISLGKNTYEPGPQQFSNLRAYMENKDGEIVIECHAEFYLEPISHYLFATTNLQTEISYTCPHDMMLMAGFNENMHFNDGNTYNGIYLGVSRGTLPGFPFVVKFTSINSCPIKIICVMHEKEKGILKTIPLIIGKKAY